MEADNIKTGGKKKLFNRWTAFLVIVISASATIFFVDSTIKANQILKDIEEINEKIKIIEQNNVILMEQINCLQSPSRIIPIAENKFKMTKIKTPPIVIKIRKQENARD